MFSGSHVAAMFTRWGLTTGVCTTTNVWSIPIAGICASWCSSMAHAWRQQAVASYAALNGGNFMFFTQLSSSHSIIMVVHTDLGAQQRVTQSLCPHYMVGRSLLPWSLFHLMTQSTQNLCWALILVIPVW